MQLYVILFLIITVSTEARKRRTGKPKIIEGSRPIPEGYQMKPKTGLYNSNEFYGSVPVPFGHIFKEGYEDPYSDFKAPIDLFDLGSRFITDGPFAREFIKKNPSKYVKIIKDLSVTTSTDPSRVLSAIRKIAGKEFNEYVNVHGNVKDDNTTDRIKSYWDFAGLLKRNLAEPPKYRLGGGQMPNQRQRQDAERYELNKTNYFSPQSFNLGNNMYDPKNVNSTTCDEFGKRAKFHPNDIVSTDWVPFYIWTDHDNGVIKVSQVHRFSYPTKRSVKNFKEEYGPLLNNSLDFGQPMLVMKYGIMEWLLVAVDRSGLFNFVSFTNIPDFIKTNSLKMSTFKIRLKIVDPYLALMYCDMKYAAILAVSGSEPITPRKCISEAAKLKFNGPGFPVRRNLQMEAMAARAQQVLKEQEEEATFSKLPDQMDAAKPQFLD